MGGGLDGVPREVLKFLEGHNVQIDGRGIKWGMSSGVLAAQLLELAHPKEVQALMLDTGSSLEARRRNWAYLELLCRRLGVPLSPSKVEECLHQSREACVELLTDLYAAVTSRAPPPPASPASRPPVPSYAAPTTSQLLKNSLLYIHEDMLETNQKTQAVVDQCLMRRREAHKRKMRRVYEQLLPEGAMDCLVPTTPERRQPPVELQPPPPPQQDTGIKGGVRQQQQQQQQAWRRASIDISFTKGIPSASRPPSAAARAASGSSSDSD